jgi:hypothetical protein
MQKATALRLTGFVGALCASGALIATSVSGTGAYFTDSHNGNINASTGHINVAISPANGQLNFTDLLPGDYQTQRVNYTANPKGGTEDIWLVFPTDGSAEAFIGAPDDAAGGGLGQYGHFAVTSTGGAHFTSYNLNNPGTTTGHTGPLCPRDDNGWGGSDAQEVYPDGPAVDFCAPSDAVLLQSNMAAGDEGHADLTFGFTPKLRSGQDGPLGSVVAYKIVATQHGIRPDNASN